MTPNKTRIWGWAGAAGVVTLLVLWLLTSYGFWPSLLLAILVAVLVAILLWIGFYRDTEDDQIETAPKPQAGSVASGTMAGKATGIAAPPNVTEAPAGDPMVENMPPETAKAEPAKPKAKPGGAKAVSDPGGAASAPPTPKAPARPAKAAVAAAPAATQGRPERLDAPRGGTADNLKQIKGVGPKLEAELHGMGIYHFEQIANWTRDEVAWMDENLAGVRQRVSRDDWVGQAKTLASGGATEFSKRVGKGDVY